MARLIFAFAVCGAILAVPVAAQNGNPETPAPQSAPGKPAATASVPAFALPPPGPHDAPVAQAPSPVPQEKPVAEASPPAAQDSPVVETPPSLVPHKTPAAQAPSSAPAEPPVAQAPPPAPVEAPVAQTPPPAPVEAPVAQTPPPAPAEAPVAQTPPPAPAEAPAAEALAQAPSPAPAEAPVAQTPSPAPAEAPVAQTPPPAPAEAPVAQTPPPAPAEKPVENTESRYTFSRMDEGYVRLDNRTGQVSFCSKRTVGWTCQLAPEDRGVLENEIARVQEENATLKKELLTRGLPLPGAMKQAPPAGEQSGRTFRLPTDPDLDRMKVLVEEAWRRLVEMISALQKDVMKKS